MEQHYPKVFSLVALFILIFYLPSANAQCMCAGGTPAFTQQHIYNTSFYGNATENIPVPQFAASTGTLICVNAKVYLTSTVRFRLENVNPNPINYIIRYIRFDTLYGPGISPNVTGVFFKDYGPYNLQGADGNDGSGPDFITTGNDTVYNNVLYQGNASNVSPYLGTGTVNFQYGSAVSTTALGSDYYELMANPQHKLRFVMTYSYCSSDVLPVNIKNFAAALKDNNNVSLSWTVQNESKNNNYEIQLSENGTQFQNIGTTRAQSADGASAKYNYQYHLDKPAHGKRYFRIGQSGGKSTVYSEIRTVNLGQDAFSGLSIYPNPVVRNITMEFDAPQTGDFQVQLTDQMGKVVYTNRVRISNGTTMQLLVSDPPPPGIYYLRARNATSSKVFASKLVFTR